MPLTDQDFTKGVDFTGLTSIVDTDLNNLVDLAVPVDDTGGCGKSLNLITVDTAADTPDVPDAATVTKWQRYTWIRIPFAGSVNKSPKLYAWNEDLAAYDPVYLKWLSLTADLTTIQADITTLDGRVDTIEGSIATLTTSVAAANSNANAAKLAADAANTTANANAANIAALSTKVDTIEDTANDAKAVADNALAVANAAQTTANTALSSATAAWTPRFVYLSEKQTKGTHAGASVLGKNIRIVNTEDSDVGALCVLDPVTGKFTVKAGVYKINATIPMSGSADRSSQAFLCKASDDSVYIAGSSCWIGSGAINDALSIINGIFTLSADTELYILHYFNAAIATYGLGRAANVAPSGGEVYTTIELLKLG